MVFGSIFSNNFGLLNAFLQSIGLAKIEWLTQPWGIKIAIATIVTWRWVGYNAIIFLAGLQAISADVYEAAKVDGAVAAADVLADHRADAAPGDPVHRGHLDHRRPADLHRVPGAVRRNTGGPGGVGDDDRARTCTRARS